MPVCSDYIHAQKEQIHTLSIAFRKESKYSKQNKNSKKNTISEYLFENIRIFASNFEYLFIMNIKQKRLNTITSIIRSEMIRNQDELQRALTNKGFEVTQATLSRDIRELKIVKRHDGNNGYIYVLPDAKPADKPAVEFSGHLAVLKTPPGYAMAIASDIDRIAPHEILATIAGDDTILVIPRDGYSNTQIAKALEPFLTGR